MTTAAGRPKPPFVGLLVSSFLVSSLIKEYKRYKLYYNRRPLTGRLTRFVFSGGELETRLETNISDWNKISSFGNGNFIILGRNFAHKSFSMISTAVFFDQPKRVKPARSLRYCPLGHSQLYGNIGRAG